MPWCSVNISYGATGYSQNYKRQLSVHTHRLQQQFVQDALADGLCRINAYLPAEHTPNPVTRNLLGINNLAVGLGSDPGAGFRVI